MDYYHSSLHRSLDLHSHLGLGACEREARLRGRDDPGGRRTRRQHRVRRATRTCLEQQTGLSAILLTPHFNPSLHNTPLQNCVFYLKTKKKIFFSLCKIKKSLQIDDLLYYAGKSTSLRKFSKISRKKKW